MEDILEKYLRYDGYDVKRVMNITDVGHLTSDADTGEDKMLKGGIHYLNSGDWVESLTALVEDYEGRWKIVKYSDIVR